MLPLALTNAEKEELHIRPIPSIPISDENRIFRIQIAKKNSRVLLFYIL